MELSERSAGRLTADAVAGRMRAYAAASRADNTWKAYQSDLTHFAAWCAGRGIAEPVPADPRDVAAYLADFAGDLAVSTLARRLYALTAIHRIGGYPAPSEAPEVQAVWRGIKRTHGTAPRQKAPARTKVIAAMLEPLEDSPIDSRDRALLLIGFAGAFRRSELVALDAGDITDTDEGLHIVVRRSKSDQEGAGDVVGVPYGSNPATCPVRAWRAWLEVRREVSGIAEGPAFVSIPKGGTTITDHRLPARVVAAIVKRRAKAAGLDDDSFAAHSLRAGFATEAFSQSVPEFSVMKHGRWKSSSSMRLYIREGSLWGDNAAAKLGL